jgi:hypothetical protein
MNTELMLRVADAIESHPKQFDMIHYAKEDGCGTVMCIAGWAVFLVYPELVGLYVANEDRPDLHDEAKELLGLSKYDADELFFATGLNEVTAPRALRRIAAGEEVIDVIDEEERASAEVGTASRTKQRNAHEAGQGTQEEGDAS